MRLFGLIGFPLSHSFSGSYFAAKFQKEGIADASYNLYPISDINILPDLIEKSNELVGLNVTIPYKEKVLPFLDEIDNAAIEIGAVNTIKIIRENKRIILKGFNTDVYGFEESLKQLLPKRIKYDKAMILGTGGASKAVAWVLKNLGFEIIYVSRNPAKPDHISYKMINERLIKEVSVIVNTSPAGMHPEVNNCPDIPYRYLTNEHILYDLIYNPEMTLFLKKGSEKGAKIKNGLQMLHLQAEKSWEIWNSQSLT